MNDRRRRLACDLIQYGSVLPTNSPMAAPPVPPSPPVSQSTTGIDSAVLERRRRKPYNFTELLEKLDELLPPPPPPPLPPPPPPQAPPPSPPVSTIAIFKEQLQQLFKLCKYNPSKKTVQLPHANGTVTIRYTGRFESTVLLQLLLTFIAMGASIMPLLRIIKNVKTRFLILLARLIGTRHAMQQMPQVRRIEMQRVARSMLASYRENQLNAFDKFEQLIIADAQSTVMDVTYLRDTFMSKDMTERHKREILALLKNTVSANDYALWLRALTSTGEQVTLDEPAIVSMCTAFKIAVQMSSTGLNLFEIGQKFRHFLEPVLLQRRDSASSSGSDWSSDWSDTT